MPLVLAVDDESSILRIIAMQLESEGFEVQTASTGEEAIEALTTIDPDIVVLDVMMPGMTGLEVLAWIRKVSTVPVILLTGQAADRQKISGLNRGADDYLTKPFDLDELIARLRALIRRSAGSPSPLVEIGDVRIDTAARTVAKSGQPVELSAKEYALLELLALHRGKLVTRTMIYEHIYGEEDDTLSNVVDVYVSNLRRKLGSELIETRRGQGYIVR
jgi:two-component system, OmpR family, response regulator